MLFALFIALLPSAASLAVRAADMSALAVLDCEMQCNKFRAAPAAPPEDALAILARAGFSTVRLRVWVNPLANHSEGEPAYVARLAERAASFGLGVMIDFHFSDWWADPGHQIKPAAWAALPFPALVDAVSAHVTAVLSLVRAGANVTHVQIGNEISPGLLWPVAGQACTDSGRVEAPCTGNWAALGALVGAGIAAARAAAPGAQIIVHTELGNKGANAAAAVQWWYSRLAAALPAGVDYDAIGLSYYMQYTALGPVGESPLARAVAKDFPGKALLLVETAYPWKASGAPPGPYPASPAGQLEFWRDTVGNASAAGIEGVAYWGGEYSGSWTALFDADYVALPALLHGFRGTP